MDELDTGIKSPGTRPDHPDDKSVKAHKPVGQV
jgi:hypothetical protein